MYRKRDGSRGFSFTKFADIIVPNLFADTTPSSLTIVLSLRQDMLYNHQLASRHFKGLDERSLFVAGVVENERMSKQSFKMMQKMGVLDSNGIVDTTKIGPKFATQLPILSHARLRDLINMLFWWEEECFRFEKLMAEDGELSDMIRAAETDVVEDRNDLVPGDLVDQLKFARERVRMKIRQRPSQRRPDTEADTDNIMDQFRTRSAGTHTHVGEGSTSGVSRNQHDGQVLEDELPDYKTIAAR